MTKKEFNRLYITQTIISIGLGISIGYAVFLHNWNGFIPSNIVAYMYNYECKACGYGLAEGDYSIVSQQGFEFCPECHDHREFETEKDGALFK